MSGEWPIARLGEPTELCDAIGTVSTGPFGSLLHASDYVANGIPLVNPINIDGSKIIPTLGKTVTAETAARLDSYKLRVNDIVVARRGELGRCAVVSDPEEGWLCGTGCFFIRPRSGVDSNFIANFLRSNTTRQALESSSSGATMPNLSNKTLASLEIKLPALDEQRRIVATLDAALGEIDELKRNRQAKIEAFGDVKASMLNSLLQPNSGAAVSDWTVVPLGTVATVSAGNPAPQGDEAFAGGTLPFIRTSDVGEVHVGEIRTTRDQVNEGAGAKLKLFPVGTVLFPKSGASTFTNHRALMRCDAYVASHLAAIKANGTDALDEYLFYYLQMVDARDLVQDQSYPSLNLKTIAAIPIPLPPLDEQRRIVATLDEAASAVDSGKTAATKQLEKADAMASSLMTELLTAA